jgi:DNA polymerase
MTEAHLDFETYSECDLKEAGGWLYAAHPSTEILCFAWAFDNDEPEIWYPGLPVPQEFYRALELGVPCHAWNANFERAINEEVAWQIGMPKVAVSQWRDDMALALMLAMPGKLATCAQVLGVAQQKDKDGQRLLNKFSCPRKPTKKDSRVRIRPEDDPADAQRLYEYCKQDVRAERAVVAALPVSWLGAYEQAIWEADSDTNARGALLDRDMVTGAVRILDKAMADGARELSAITGGLVTTPGQRDRIKAWLASQGVHVDSLAAEFMPEIQGRPMPAKAARLLEVYASCGQSSTSKYPTMLGAMSPRDDRVRGIAQYHSATTGRWGGRKVQFQNLPRPSIDTRSFHADVCEANHADIERIAQACGLDAMTVLRDSLRHSVIAPPGKTLIVSDLASIEARVLGWVAGEQIYLDTFAAGKNLYIVTASNVFGIPYDQVKKGTVEYQVGKESVLGLGYQMGGPTFIGNCRDKGVPVDKAPDSLILEAHQKYRQTYKNIVKYWRDIETCAVACISTGKPTKLGHCRMEMIKGFLTIQLPSGRRLWYAGAHTAMKRMPWGEERLEMRFYVELKPNVWGRSSSYGGKLTENIVQAIARDLLAEALVCANRSGILAPVMTVHDEIVAEAPEGTDPKVLEHMMTKPLPWTTGLPLGAEAFSSPYYKK